jgi:hypothetical protein
MKLIIVNERKFGIGCVGCDEPRFSLSNYLFSYAEIKWAVATATVKYPSKYVSKSTVYRHYIPGKGTAYFLFFGFLAMGRQMPKD